MKNFPRISLVAILVLAIIICGVAVLSAFATAEAFIPAGVCTSPPPNMVSWWPGDGNSNDIEDGNNGTLQGGTTFAPGMVGQAFNFDGVDDYVNVVANPNLHPAAISVDAWLQARDLSNPPGTTASSIITSNLGDFDGYQLQIEQDGTVGLVLGGGAVRTYYRSNPATVVIGQWYHVAVTYDGFGGTGSLKLYINGVPRAFSLHSCFACTEPSGPIFYSGDYPLTIGQRNQPAVGNFSGLIDEVEVFSRPLTPSEILAIFNAGSGGKCKPECVTPPSGMISWWAGDNDALDLQDGNHGTLKGGVTFVAGRVGPAFNFDGVDDRVMTFDSPSLRFGTGDLSVDAWIKAPPGTDYGGIVGKELQTFPYPSILLRLDGGKASFGVLDCGTGACGFSAPGGGGSRQMVISPFRVDDNNFHHVAGVRRPSGYELYVDGVLVATHAEPARNPDSDAPLFIGMQSDNPSLQLPFTGVIDEVEIFNRALSAFEIQAIFNAGSAGKCKPTPTPTPSPTPTPTPPPHVGPPTNKDQCKNGGWQTFDTPRHFKNQGDCIQFVDTGK